MASGSGTRRLNPRNVGRAFRLLAPRVFEFLATVIGVGVFVQLLLLTAPGDPIDLLPNSDAVRPALEARWNLDRPIPDRLFRSVMRLLRGDLGRSLVYRPEVPVTEIIGGPALRSIGWLLGALTLSVLWGAVTAAATAGRRSFARPLFQALSITPVFLLAHLLVHGINDSVFWMMQRGLLSGPPSWFALPAEPGMMRGTLAIFILAVGSGTLADVIRAIENRLIAIRSSDYIDAVRARGGDTRPHVLVNLLPTLVTVLSDRTAFMVGGLVILEKVLLLNGLGSLLWRATLDRDYELAMGVTLVFATIVCLVRLLGDLARLALDPRERE